jgi:PAS domain S-box-containing protein
MNTQDTIRGSGDEGNDSEAELQDLKARLEERTRFAALSAEVCDALAAGCDLREVLPHCARALVHRLDTLRACIWLLHDEEGTLELRATAGVALKPENGRVRLAVGEGRVGRIAQERRPYLTNAIADDPFFKDLVNAAGEGATAFAGHPMLVEGRLVGVLTIFNRRRLSGAALETLGAVARSLALGVKRIQAEQTLYRLAALVECSDDAILSETPQGLVSSWNPGAERLFGYTAREAIGRPVVELFPPERQEEIAAASRRVQGGVRVAPFETLVRRKDDGCLDALVSMSPIRDRERRLPGAALIVQDISAAKRLEAQYQHAQKMEAVGKLAGGVAHDFNNLLTVILGYAELLLFSPHLDEQNRRLVAEINKSGQHAASLTRQLLTFSRKQVVSPRLLDLNVVIGGVKQMLQRLLGEDVYLTQVLDPDLRLIKADPGQLEQILLNLAVNARDAMPQGGKLTIETTNVYLDETYVRTHADVEPGRYVMLAVSDTGCGMDEATQARLFEPFFTTKEIGKGTGLGLSTVYGIVKQCGGHIWVYSELGRGSTFKVYLPWAEGKTPSAKSGEMLLRAPRGTETVLLVEDEDAVRALARKALETSGYTVLEASRGEEAIRLCQDRPAPIHLLVTDVVMPGMSGRSVAEQAATIHPEMKVLYLSGYTDDAVVRHGVLEAELAFVQKPFTPSLLARKVREVLDGGRLEASGGR